MLERFWKELVGDDSATLENCKFCTIDQENFLNLVLSVINKCQWEVKNPEDKARLGVLKMKCSIGGQD